MKNNIKKIVLSVLILLSIQWLASLFFHRFDFTKEKRFTLSELSKNKLAQLDSPIIISVFLNGDLPPTFKRLKDAVSDLLEDYKAYSHGNIQVRFIDPLKDIEAPTQDSLMNLLAEMELQPTNLSVKTDEGFQQKLIFPEAIIQYKDRQKTVKILQNFGHNYEENINNSIQNLEYTLTSNLEKITENELQRVVFTEGHGELNDLQLQNAMQNIGLNYEVGRIQLSVTNKEGLDKIKLLIVAKPQTEFSEADKYKIDYLVHKGVPVIWSIDQIAAELDSLQGMRSQLVFNRKLNLDDMLFEYGARINYNVVADMNCSQIPLNVGSVSGQAQIQMVPWLYYPILIPDSVQNLVKNIDGIRSEFASSVDSIQAPGISHQVLLRTSPFRKIYSTPKPFSLQMVEEEPNPKEMYGAPTPIALLLKGKFKTVFALRPVPEGISPLPFSTPKPNKMVVIGDGDLFKNQFSINDGSVFPLGYDRYTQQTFGNKNLLLNLIDGLIDDSGLIDLRSKQFKIRLLNKVKVKQEKSEWQIINVVLPLILLTIIAFLQQYFRKRRFAK